MIFSISSLYVSLRLRFLLEVVELRELLKELRVDCRRIRLQEVSPPVGDLKVPSPPMASESRCSLPSEASVRRGSIQD